MNVECIHCNISVLEYNVLNKGGLFNVLPDGTREHICPPCVSRYGTTYLCDWHWLGGSWKEFSKSFALFCYDKKIPSELLDIEKFFMKWVNETEAKNYYHKKNP